MPAAILSAAVVGFVIRGWLPGLVACVAFVPVLMLACRSRTVVGGAVLIFTSSLGLLAAAFEGALTALPWAFPVALSLAAPVYGLPGGLAAWSRRSLTPGVVVWSLPVTWTAAEFVAGRRWLFGPYASPVALGYTQLDSPLLYLAAAAGVTGVTLAVLVSNASIAHSLLIRTPWPLAGILVVILSSISVTPPTEPMEDADGWEREVALVQPALPLSLYRASSMMPEAREYILDRLLELSRLVDRTDLLVWPEGAVPASTRLAELASLVSSRFDNVELIAGAVSSDRNGDRFNSAVYVHAGRSTPVFDKLAPVPVGEAGIRAGSWLVLAHWADLWVAPLICLDSAYPTFSLRLARLGAELLVVLSDDSFAQRMATPELHLRTSTFRAVETGLPLVFASAAGPSAIVSPYGRALTRSEFGVPATLQASVRRPTTTTPFVRFGEWVGLGCVLLSVAFMALVRIAPLFRRDNQPPHDL